MKFFFDGIKNQIIPVLGLFDTEEEIRKARESLEKATEEDFKKLEKIKRLTLVNAKNIILD